MGSAQAPALVTRARRQRFAGPLALAVLAVAGWASVTPAAGAAGEGLGLPGVDVAVHAVTPERLAHQAGMPPGMMPDPLPDGVRRVAVDVTVTGRGSGGRYAGADLRLTGPDLPDAVAPERTDLGAGRLARGVRVTGTVVFAVAESVQAVSLTALGGEGSLPLHLPAAGHPPGGH